MNQGKKIKKWGSYSWCIRGKWQVSSRDFFQPSMICSLQWSLAVEGTVKIKALISFKWTQHHLAVFLLSHLVLHQGLSHPVLWYSAVITPLKCACPWVLLLQMISYTAQHFEALQSTQCHIRKHLINAFKMSLLVLKMMIADSATQPTLFSHAWSINCLKFFCIAMATLILQQSLKAAHRKAFIFQASCCSWELWNAHLTPITYNLTQEHIPV